MMLSKHLYIWFFSSLKGIQFMLKFTTNKHFSRTPFNTNKINN